MCGDEGESDDGGVDPELSLPDPGLFSRLKAALPDDDDELPAADEADMADTVKGKIVDDGSNSLEDFGHLFPNHFFGIAIACQNNGSPP